MKKKLTNIVLILISAFAFTSCGDSKEAVVDDMIDFMKKSAKTMASGDKDAISKLEEEGKKLEERAKAVGIDVKDPSSMPDELKKKFKDATADMMKKVIEDAGK